MSAPGRPSVPLPSQRLEQARRQALRVLRIEQAWPSLLPVLDLVLALLIACLLTLPQRLPAWAHALLLAALVAGAGWWLRRRLLGLEMPSVRQRDRRIERASRLPHRPLDTLADRPASVGPFQRDTAELIWQTHLRRTETGLARLTAGRPRLRADDRFGVLGALLGGLLVALLLAGADAPLRLASGLWPGLEIPLGARPVLQAWITPPDYAGGAPVFLIDPHGHYDAAAGAQLTVSLTGLDARPSISAGSGGPVSLERLSTGSWTARLALPATTRITVRGAGYGLADWTVAVPPGTAPVVSWSAAPGPAADEPWHTRLPWSVAHRYGVRSLVAELRLATPPRGLPVQVLRIPIPLPDMPTAAHGVALPDLVAHPWAGAAVVGRLVATDVTGRTGTSADARFTLPARPFRNPLARAVLDVRRRLALGRESAPDAADDLQALGDTPGEFAKDSSLFLNLGADAALLRLPEAGVGRLDEASGRLWELALALEDGLHNDRAGARAALEVRGAQDRLAAQLEHMRQLGEKGQTEAERSELHARIAALGAAIARRMQALAAQAAHDHVAMPAMADSSLGAQDLDRMLQRMQQAAASGHAEQAMQQLSQMQAMLDHMRAATPQDLESARQQAEGRRQAEGQMDATRDLVKRQSALLDHAQSRQAASDRAEAEAQSQGQGQAPGQIAGGGVTTSDGEDSDHPGDAAGSIDPATQALMRQLGIQPGGSQPDPQADPSTAHAPADGGTPPAVSAAARGAQQADQHAQHVLRRAVDELATEFKALTGKEAAGLTNAMRAMDRARDALAAGQDAPAVSAQTEALADLQKGAQQMRSAMSGGSGGSGGLALLPGGGPGAGGTAPGQEDADGDATDSPDQQDGRDPLGRHLASGHSGMDDGDDTHVPDRLDPARSREIEQELRRRDGDRTRPAPELDYLDRLLKTF